MTHPTPFCALDTVRFELPPRFRFVSVIRRLRPRMEPLEPRYCFAAVLPSQLPNAPPPPQLFTPPPANTAAAPAGDLLAPQTPASVAAQSTVVPVAQGSHA